MNLQVTLAIPHNSSAHGDSFLVHVNSGKKAWTIERSIEEFINLKVILLQERSAEVDASSWKDADLEGSKDVNIFETFLIRVLASFADNLWMTECLLAFLDNAPRKSPMAELQMARLSQQIEQLTRRSQELEAFQEELQNTYMEVLEKLKATGSVGLVGPAPTESIRKTTNGEVPRLSLISVITTDSATETSTTTTGQVMTSMEGPNYMSDEEMVMTGRSPLMSGDFTPTPVRSGSLEPIREEDIQTFLGVPILPASDNPPALPNSPYLPLDIIPLGEKSVPLDSSIDYILKLIGPTEEQIQHRASIVALCKRQIRLALGATAFEIGIQVSRCLLPDDPIKLTVIISKSLVPTWHTVVCEQFTSFAEKANIYGGSNYVPVDEDEVLDPYFSDCHSYGNHMLGNVSHSKQNLIHSVQLVIDSIPVEICANVRHELCMLSFLEEVSSLVGKDHLFKRSLLLIRAWWAYETPSFVGCVIRHYLTDYHLLVMLTGIFNRYHNQITTPLHALSFFLAEFSAYDGNNQCISIQGLVPFQTRASNQPQLVDVSAHHLLDGHMLEKHWQSYNIGHITYEPEITKKRSVSTEDHSISTGTASSVTNLSVGNNSATNSANTSPTFKMIPGVVSSTVSVSSGGGNMQSSAQQPVAPSQPSASQQDLIRETMKSLSTNNLYFFDRNAFNIVHPLTHSNMITEKLSQRRISRLYKAFQIGATNFAFYLKRAMETNPTPTNSNEAMESMKNYFPTILTHANAWNKNFQEINLTTILTTSYDMQRIDYDVSYCNLMIETSVTDHALQMLAMEILAQKGPLPVGEIGKILAEMTSIPSLSLKLKEKFGGLKKFLEQYPGHFVVSNDHPFNPNVLLRCSLSQEHLELIDKGIFPHQLLIKAKKAAAASAKKKKSHSVPSFPPPNTSPETVYRGGGGMGGDHGMGGYNNGPNPSMYRSNASGGHMSSTNLASMSAMAKVNMNMSKHNNPGMVGGNTRSKSIPSSKASTHYPNMGGYGPGMPNGPGNLDNNPAYGGYHNYMEESHNMHMNSQQQRRSYNSGEYSGNTTNNMLSMNTNSHHTQAYFDEMLGNSTAADQNFLLSQLRGENMDMSGSRGYVDFNSSPPTSRLGSSSNSGKINPSNPYNNTFDTSSMMHSLGGANNNGGFDSDPHRSFSVIGNLFPLKLSPEELNSLGLGNTSGTGNAGNGASGLDDHGRDYSSLPSNMF